MIGSSETSSFLYSQLHPHFPTSKSLNRLFHLFQNRGANVDGASNRLSESREVARIVNPYLDSSSTAAGGSIRQMHKRNTSAPSDSASTEERRGQAKPAPPGASNRIQVQRYA